MKTISIAVLLLGSLSPVLVASPVQQEAPASNQAMFNLVHEMIALQIDAMADALERGDTPESRREINLVPYRFWKSADLSRVPASLYPYARERQLLAERLLSFFDRYPDVDDENEWLISDQEMKLQDLLDAYYAKESAMFESLYKSALMMSGAPHLVKQHPDTLDQAQRDALIKKIRAAAAAQRAMVKPVAQVAPPQPSSEQRALALYALRRALRSMEAQAQLYREGKGEDGDAFFKFHTEAVNATPLDGLAPRLQEYIKAEQEADAAKGVAQSLQLREKYGLEWRQVGYAMMRVIFDCATMSPEAAREVYGRSLLLRPEDKADLPQRIKVIEGMMQMLRVRIAQLETEAKA